MPESSVICTEIDIVIDSYALRRLLLFTHDQTYNPRSIHVPSDLCLNKSVVYGSVFSH